MIDRMYIIHVSEYTHLCIGREKFNFFLTWMFVQKSKRCVCMWKQDRVFLKASQILIYDLIFFHIMYMYLMKTFLRAHSEELVKFLLSHSHTHRNALFPFTFLNIFYSPYSLTLLLERERKKKEEGKLGGGWSVLRASLLLCDLREKLMKHRNLLIFN